MANDSFSATVGQWAEDVEGAVEAIFRRSVVVLERTAQLDRGAGGRLRVDTGFLRASLMASTSQMPAINPAARPAEGQTYPYTGAEIEAVIASAEIGQTIYLGYTASYAAHREYGARGQAPDAFVRTAAQQWPTIVSQVESELKGRLGL